MPESPPPLLAVVVLLRDEADIFPAFAQHIAALFDIALFLDHGSIDGTSALIDAACEKRRGWQRWHIAVPGFYQSLFTTFAVRHVFATTAATTIFLLDADEFIDVPDRATLLHAIAANTAPRAVPMLIWSNAVPVSECNAPLAFGDKLLIAPSASPFQKAVIPRAVFEATGGRLTVLAGNHIIDPCDGIALKYQPIGTILHVPLRSTAQWARKTIAAALGHLARTDRPPHEGRHRFEGLARIAKGNLTWNDCLGWASRYGETAEAATAEALRARGFTDRILDVAHSIAPEPPPLPPPPPDVAASTAAALLAWRPAPGARLVLELHGNTLTARPAETQLMSEADMMRASTSWRITAPLRAVGGWLRRARASF